MIEIEGQAKKTIKKKKKQKGLQREGDSKRVIFNLDQNEVKEFYLHSKVGLEGKFDLFSNKF